MDVDVYSGQPGPGPSRRFLRLLTMDGPAASFSPPLRQVGKHAQLRGTFTSRLDVAGVTQRQKEILPAGTDSCALRNHSMAGARSRKRVCLNALYIPMHVPRKVLRSAPLHPCLPAAAYEAGFREQWFASAGNRETLSKVTVTCTDPGCGSKGVGWWHAAARPCARYVVVTGIAHPSSIEACKHVFWSIRGSWLLPRPAVLH